MTVHDVRVDLEECAIEPLNIQRRMDRSNTPYYVLCLSPHIWLRVVLHDHITLGVKSFYTQYRVRIISGVTAKTDLLRWPHYEPFNDLLTGKNHLKSEFYVTEWPTLLNNIRRMIR